MLERALELIDTLSQTISLELFVMVGTLLEEIIAPIPSPLVMTTAGSLIQAQGHAWPYMLLIGVIAAASKTVGALIFYVLGDKCEDIVVPRFGKFIGVTHEELEHYGDHFRGNWKDELILLFLRSIPFMPSTPISAVCGIIKIPMRSFLTATFVGFYLRELFFLALGYTGLHALQSVMTGIESLETIMKIIVLGVVGGVVLWMYYKRMKSSRQRAAQKK